MKKKPTKKLKGLAAWLPTPKETAEFYKCNCSDPTKRVCYWPGHRFERVKKQIT